jgi:hypothetical protein
MKNQRWEILFVFIVPLVALLAIATGLVLSLIQAFLRWIK